MSIQSAAYRLARAVRDRQQNAEAPPYLRAILDEQVESALCGVDDALRGKGWDGSEPCHECKGKGSFQDRAFAGHITFTPCGLCAGTGHKNVTVRSVA